MNNEYFKKEKEREKLLEEKKKEAQQLRHKRIEIEEISKEITSVKDFIILQSDENTKQKV